MNTARASQRSFVAVSALLFGASATATIVWCASMSALGENAYARRLYDVNGVAAMPGQTWLGAAASFLGFGLVDFAAPHSTYC